ncbi:reverse transcriptase N-terminal domain-containing protein [Streptomyces sp. NPDC058001]|uniref:reverse transcriptase N-terminal domain-containing protein n=1 Tax=Streptomyces sp. NPDC058001 TaxID=3346300 RepID=UPI0036DFF1DF
MKITAPVVTSSPVVNGPEDELLDGHGIDWATCEENVRRLRQRIFKATQEEDWKNVTRILGWHKRGMVDTGQTFDPRGAEPEVCWRGAADRLLQCCGSAACMPVRPRRR